METPCIRQEPIYSWVKVPDGPGWSGSAFSNSALANSGYFRFGVPVTTSGAVIGFAVDPSGSDYNGITHGFMFQNGRYAVCEHGELKTEFTTYNHNDTFLVFRFGTTVYYLVQYANVVYTILPGTIVYTSEVPSFGSVYLDASLYAVGDRITFAEMSEEAAAYFVAPLSAVIRWTEEAITDFLVPVTATVNWVGANNAHFTTPMILAPFWSQDEWTSFTVPLRISTHWEQVYIPITSTFTASLSGSVHWETWTFVGGYFVVRPSLTVKWFAESNQTDICARLSGLVSWVGSQNAPINRLYFCLFLTGTQPQSNWLIGDMLKFAGSMRLQPRSTMSSVLNLTNIISGQVATRSHISSSVLTQNLFSRQVSLLLEDTSLSFVDNYYLTNLAVLSLASVLQFSTSMSLIAQTALTFATHILFSDILARGELVDLFDEFAFVDQLEHQLSAMYSVEEIASFIDSIAGAAFVIYNDEAQFTDQTDMSVAALLVQRDTILFFTGITLGDEQYQGWVMNADSTAVTTYSNFPFNSLFTYDGVPYGLTANGLYKLEGDDDDGAPINAIIATGDIDFNSPRKKNVPRAYLYITQDGGMLLKVITIFKGRRDEVYYEVAQRPSDMEDDLTFRRVPLGRGAVGSWWRFELHTVDGTRFSLDSAEVRPVLLSR